MQLRHPRRLPVVTSAAPSMTEPRGEIQAKEVTRTGRKRCHTLTLRRWILVSEPVPGVMHCEKRKGRLHMRVELVHLPVPEALQRRFVEVVRRLRLGSVNVGNTGRSRIHLTAYVSGA